MPNIRAVSWPEYMEAVGRLAAMLPKQAELWGIPRGGALLARMLIYQRSDLMLRTLLPSPYPRLFVVDDIADSGATLLDYKDHQTAVLFRRYGCLAHPDIVASELAAGDDAWLVFPYENPKLDVPGARQSMTYATGSFDSALEIPEPQPGEPEPPKGCVIRESRDRPDPEGAASG